MMPGRSLSLPAKVVADITAAEVEVEVEAEEVALTEALFSTGQSCGFSTRILENICIRIISNILVDRANNKLLVLKVKMRMIFGNSCPHGDNLWIATKEDLFATAMLSDFATLPLAGASTPT